MSTATTLQSAPKYKESTICNFKQKSSTQCPQRKPTKFSSVKSGKMMQ